MQTTSENSSRKRRSFSSYATSFLRGWFIAIGYQIPFEGGRRWQQWLPEIRPLADTRPGALPGFPNAVSLEFNCHTFFCALGPKRSSALKNLVPPGLEPGTFRVLSERDNHYTTELTTTVARENGRVTSLNSVKILHDITSYSILNLSH